MTFSRYSALEQAWERQPRPEAFLAAYFEYKPPKKQKIQPIEDLIAIFGLRPGVSTKVGG